MLPVLSALLGALPKAVKWVVVLEDDAKVSPDLVQQALAQFSSMDKVFLGRALFDHQHAIIHHYHGDFSLGFPDFACGYALSRKLIRALVKRIGKDPLPASFTIDPQHELAKYIYDDGRGVRLIHSPAFCAFDGPECAVAAHSGHTDALHHVAPSNIFFAVKTCTKYHDTRLKNVISTWAKDAPHIAYYSDSTDAFYPTVSTGVENTDQGHCAKLEAILRRVHSEQPHMPWIAVVDDDTRMNVTRLARLLSRYDADEALLLGEKYAYGLSQPYGYEFITGGGGMVLSRAGLRALVESEDCTCGRPDAPDDMWLGMCFRRIGKPLIHTPTFHQAQPAVCSIVCTFSMIC